MPPLAVTLVILIRTYDAFGVPLHNLDEARRTADATLGPAGLEATWTSCPSTPVIGLQSPRCLDLPATGEVMIRIVSGRDGWHTEDTLGYAFVDTKEKRGALATLYAPRIAALADQAGIDRGTLLGRVMAHEVGHLLLGTSDHRPRGLMRARWTLDELRQGIERDWRFSRLDAKEMRLRVFETTRPSR